MRLFFFSAIIACLAVLLTVTLINPLVAQASHGGPPPHPGGPPPVEPQTYLSNLYIWFLGFVGIAALFAIVWGGIQYMFSGANLTKAESGRTWITNAIWGIILAASAYLILYTINPDFVTHGFDINKVINNALIP